MNRPSELFDGASPSWNEQNVPPVPDPERPPLAPHDPPDPAPQAAAWERALRVIFMEATQGPVGVTKGRSWRTNKRGRAAIKVVHKPLRFVQKH